MESEMSVEGEAVMSQVPDDVKKDYMARVYKMTHGELFHELMRVHGESAKMIMELQAKVDELSAGPNEVAGGGS
jgi:hypothetical protein